MFHIKTYNQKSIKKDLSKLLVIFIFLPGSLIAQWNTNQLISTSSTIPRHAFPIDLDNDGNMDVISTGASIYWHRNLGGGSFTDIVLTTAPSGAFQSHPVDLDEDGDTDILYADHSGNDIGWLENDGSNNFSVNMVSTSVTGASSVYSADFDGDGDIDVLSAGFFSDEVRWHRNDGAENFTDITIETNLNAANYVYAVDIDSDGDVDALSVSIDDDKVNWYENDGLGNFTTHLVSTQTNGPTGVIGLDIDQDGDIDIVSSSWHDDKITLFENDGSENFTEITISSLSYDARSVSAIDTDLDGDMDLLSAGWGNNAIIHENNGDGTFGLEVVFSGLSNGYTAFGADFDNDGDVDMVTSSFSDNRIAWHENLEGPPPISSETDFVTFSIPGQIGISVIDPATHTIQFNVPSSTSVDNLVATFTLFTGASTAISGTAQVSGTTANDFTSPVIYTVTAEDGTTVQDWTVTANILSNETEIMSYSLPGSSGAAHIDMVAHAITIPFLDEEGVDNLVAMFSLSPGAFATIAAQPQTSGVTSNDFTSPLTYSVTSEDASTTQDWTVQINYISLCEALAGHGLNCDVETSRLTVSEDIAGDGVSVSNGKLNVSIEGDLATAYYERGSQIAGRGLKWNGTELDFDGSQLTGRGIKWNNNAFEFDAKHVISDDFNWDPYGKKLSLKEGVASYWKLAGPSTIHYTASNPSSTQVGIGTASVPTGYMLAVAGDIIANNIRVDNIADGWPDFVFKRNYQLLSLMELDQFIRENHHLPGIPSAEEVAEEGIDLAEMDAKLLQKVEELTLYVLGQEKELQALEKENKELERRLKKLKKRNKK